jgi:hypothetical protein
MGAEVGNFGGVESTFETLDMNMSGEAQYGYHISNEVWMNQEDGQWVEEGLARGCTVYGATDFVDCTSVGGTTSLFQFWADLDTNSNFNFHLINTISASTTTHTYEIWNKGACGDIYLYIDGNSTGHTNSQPQCTVPNVQAGMELDSPGINSNEYTGDEYSNQTKVYGTSWTNADFDSGTSDTFPCGYYDNCGIDPCSEQPDGSCLHQSRTSDSVWSDYKPS